MVREKVFRQDRLAVDILDRIAEDMVITFRKSFRISNDQDLVDAGGKDEKIFSKRIRVTATGSVWNIPVWIWTVLLPVIRVYMKCS